MGLNISIIDIQAIVARPGNIGSREAGTNEMLPIWP
jgi:hypothetical protein